MNDPAGEQRLDAGALTFSVEARLLRELGERLVRRPETALIELIKNSHDADARECRVARRPGQVVISDDGVGMTFDEFAGAWMRIGTASKARSEYTASLGRSVTGEKGIGRFSVRFLGEQLHLDTVADDPKWRRRTRLRATFDWPAYDASEDLGSIEVPYELTGVSDDIATGTRLVISKLRPAAGELDENQVRTASIGLVSPLSSLINVKQTRTDKTEPGFRLILDDGETSDDEKNDTSSDIALPVLDAFALRARLRLRGRRLTLQIFAASAAQAEFELTDTVAGRCGDLQADIRFFPRRVGMFRDLGVDGRIAYTWIRENSGVAVFDRNFRVSPYGEPSDDWLGLSADVARNTRKPRSSLAQKHFPMTDAEQSSTAENWMLRLPQSSQLVGVVQVAGSRGSTKSADEGLVAAADREGFLSNTAFTELKDHVRGGVEAIAMVDRRLQRRQEDAERARRLRSLQDEAAAAAEEVEQNPNISRAEKTRIVKAIKTIASDASAHEAATRERIRQLEVMSLLGVVAGFMTHEFGVALAELDTAYQVFVKALKAVPDIEIDFSRFEAARKRLVEFTDYSTAYIRGSRTTPERPYSVLPRVTHVCRTFAGYADERDVTVQTEIDKALLAPQIPTSLYDGIVLNLFTNALKAVTGTAAPANRRLISFRAWNEKTSHYLEVVDTGVGIPEVLWERVFDPLFTTTDSRNDPLGSGMGLGLSLVRASAQAFAGKVRLIAPPPGFSTCVQVEFPLRSEENA